MSKSEKSSGADAPSVFDPADGVQLALSGDVLDRIGKVVTFSDKKSVQDFVADAINTYLQLGNLHAEGAEIFMTHPKRKDQMRIRLPFENAAARDGETQG